MIFINQPVLTGKVTTENAEEFAAELKRVKGPVLAFCRSGMRSITLWALNEARHMDADNILNFAAGIGYDLKVQRDKLEDIAAQVSGSDEPVQRSHYCR